MHRREFLLAAAAAAKGPERLKVTGVRIYLVEVGGRHPVLAQVLTDKGVTGVGEAAGRHPSNTRRCYINDIWRML